MLVKRITSGQTRLYEQQPSGISDYEFYFWIWKGREHRSEVSGEPLQYVFGPHMLFVFSHILTKGSAPAIRHLPLNIVLMTDGEHHLWEFERHKLKEDPRWAWVFTLQSKLIMNFNNEKFRIPNYIKIQ